MGLKRTGDERVNSEASDFSGKLGWNIGIFQHIDDISYIIIELLNMKFPERCEWKNTSVLFAIILGTMPMLRISSA